MDPVRFLSDSSNLYQFVGNNPGSHVDPLGTSRLSYFFFQKLKDGIVDLSALLSLARQDYDTLDADEQSMVRDFLSGNYDAIWLKNNPKAGDALRVIKGKLWWQFRYHLSSPVGPIPASVLGQCCTDAVSYVRSLVPKLGDKRFAVREATAGKIRDTIRMLLSLGAIECARMARQALIEEGNQSPDAEINNRAGTEAENLGRLIDLTADLFDLMGRMKGAYPGPRIPRYPRPGMPSHVPGFPGIVIPPTLPFDPEPPPPPPVKTVPF
jgi:hypothetical protein